MLVAVGERTNQALRTLLEMTEEGCEEDWTIVTELNYFYQFTAEFLEYTICQMEN